LGDPPMPGAATALSTVVVLFMIPLVVWQRHITTSRRYTTITSSYKPQVMKLRRWRWPTFAIILAFGIYLTVIPAAFLVMGTFMKLFGFFDIPTGAWTTRHWTDAFSDGGLISGIQNTLIMSAGSATLAMVFSRP
jgi:iron(III) transport system permease protein